MHRPMCLASGLARGSVEFEFQPRLLCKATIDVIIHLRNLVRRMNRDGSSVRISDFGEGRHSVSLDFHKRFQRQTQVL